MNFHLGADIDIAALPRVCAPPLRFAVRTLGLGDPLAPLPRAPCPMSCADRCFNVPMPRSHGVCRQCGCNYPSCRDQPDDPAAGKFCSLCGPKYNDYIVINLWNKPNPTEI